jgi:hypothetical protein
MSFFDRVALPFYAEFLQPLLLLSISPVTQVQGTWQNQRGVPARHTRIVNAEPTSVISYSVLHRKAAL